MFLQDFEKWLKREGKRNNVSTFKVVSLLVLFYPCSPSPLLPHLMGPFGNLLQMAEEGMEGMEGAAMAGEAAMDAADMAMMGGRMEEQEE